MKHDDLDLCAWTEERLELFLDGELSGSENLRFQTHLKECDECAAYWADDEAIAEALLLTVAPDLESHAPFLDDPNFAQGVLDRGEKRPITHHSSSVVVVGRSPFFWSSISALAASILTTVVGLGYFKAEVSPNEVTVAEAPVIRKAHVGFTQGQVEVRRSDNGPWGPVTPKTELFGQVDLRTQADSRLLVRLTDGGGQVLLAENSKLRIAVFPSADAKRLTLELDEGRLSCDLGDVRFRAGTMGLDFSGSEASFDLTSGEGDIDNEIDARLAVTRGYVVACADIGAEKKITEGQVYAVKDGMLLAFDRLQETDSVQLVHRRNRPRSPRKWDVDETLWTDFSADSHRAREIRSISSEQISSWLSGLVKQGFIDLVDPGAATRQMYEQARESGSKVLSLIRPMMKAEKIPLRRRGLVALAGVLRGEEAAAFLRRACSDSSLSVRTAAVFCLSRFSASYGAHFAAMCEKEKNLTLKLSTAFLAAHAGEKRGLDELVAMYSEETSHFLRLQVVQLVARVERPLAGRAEFLTSVIERCKSWRDREIFGAAMRGLSKTKESALARKPLKILLDMDGVGQRMKTLVRQTLQSLKP